MFKRKYAGLIIFTTLWVSLPTFAQSSRETARFLSNEFYEPATDLQTYSTPIAVRKTYRKHRTRIAGCILDVKLYTGPSPDDLEQSAMGDRRIRLGPETKVKLLERRVAIKDSPTLKYVNWDEYTLHFSEDVVEAGFLGGMSNEISLKRVRSQDSDTENAVYRALKKHIRFCTKQEDIEGHLIIGKNLSSTNHNT